MSTESPSTIRAVAPLRSPPAPPARIPGQPGLFTRYEGFIYGFGAVAIFVAIWQVVAYARVVPALFLPGPADIWQALVLYVEDGSIWNDLAVSGEELIYGFGLAVIVGLPLGLLGGWYRRANMALDPFVNFMNAMPRIALVPLLIIWFGIGIWSKVAVIFLSSVFPVLINTEAGIRNLDAGWIKAAHSFGASDMQLFRTVALPGAIPFILTGMRIGVGHALIGVVVGELVAARAGIGLMMATAGASFQTAKVFAGLIIVSSAGMLLVYVISRVERRFQAWRPPQ
jgi:ABC-type nitrate/sulfonate/bicarbonate transport system permease component